MRCPAEIVPYNVALLGRRVFGKYIIPKSKELEKAVKETKKSKINGELKNLAEMHIDELKKMYEEREID